MAITTLILASKSKYRAELLGKAGMAIITKNPNINERKVSETQVPKTQVPKTQTPKAQAQFLAQKKCEKISKKYPNHIVLGCDQILCLNNKILHKVKTLTAAKQRLALLSGKTHKLYSAIALAKNGKVFWQYVATSTMTMKKLSTQQITEYINQMGTDILNTVGCYKFESPQGKNLFTKYSADKNSIIGLPLTPLLKKVKPLVAKPLVRSLVTKTFVIGMPIRHSLSPLIHGHWLDIYNINGKYKKIAIAKKPKKNLKNFLRTSNNKYLGGNITLPHKQTAFSLVDKTDNLAKKIGAINTIYWQNNILHGLNSDAYGFLANLDEQAKGWDKNKTKPVLIIGAGGAARAIIVAIKSRGVKNIYITNRTLANGENLAKQFNCKIFAWQNFLQGDFFANINLLVNTTSLGIKKTSMSKTNKIRFNFAKLPKNCICNDIVYSPLQTNFLLAAKKYNLTAIDGLGMLLHQATIGFEKWYKVRPQVTKELRAILLRALGELPTANKTNFLAITGSIAMGKTTIANLFAELGVPICNLDNIVHDIYKKAAVKKVQKFFPTAIKNGEVDRKILAKLIMMDAKKLAKLETIVKPFLRAAMQNFKTRVRREKAPLAIFDAPLLFEQGLDKQMDYILVVTAPLKVQKKRAMLRKNMTEKKFNILVARQLADSQKRARADFIIDTNKNLKYNKKIVMKIYQQLIEKKNA